MTNDVDSQKGSAFGFHGRFFIFPAALIVKIFTVWDVDP